MLKTTTEPGATEIQSETKYSQHSHIQQAYRVLKHFCHILGVVLLQWYVLM
jgi:hypothetical protein